VHDHPRRRAGFWASSLGRGGQRATAWGVGQRAPCSWGARPSLCARALRSTGAGAATRWASPRGAPAGRRRASGSGRRRAASRTCPRGSGARAARPGPAAQHAPSRRKSLDTASAAGIRRDGGHAAPGAAPDLQAAGCRADAGMAARAAPCTPPVLPPWRKLSDRPAAESAGAAGTGAGAACPALTPGGAPAGTRRPPRRRRGRARTRCRTRAHPAACALARRVGGKRGAAELRAGRAICTLPSHVWTGRTSAPRGQRRVLRSA